MPVIIAAARHGDRGGDGESCGSRRCSLFVISGVLRFDQLLLPSRRDGVRVRVPVEPREELVVDDTHRVPSRGARGYSGSLTFSSLLLRENVMQLLVVQMYGLLESGAFYVHWSPYDRVRRGERRSLRTFAGVSLRPGSLAFNPRPYDAFQLQLTPFNSTPTFASYGNGPQIAANVGASFMPVDTVDLGHRGRVRVLQLVRVRRDSALGVHDRVEDRDPGQAGLRSPAPERMKKILLSAAARSIHWFPYDRVAW